MTEAASVTPASSSLTSDERAMLKTVAVSSISNGLSFGSPMTIFLNCYSAPLREHRASFTTLEIEHRLRGCIGSLVAARPLVEDVAQNAFNAAFRDPRFPRLSAAELPRLSIHISILTPAQPMSFSSEANLLAQLRPGVDGLILEETTPQLRRGTFLPAVWASLPEPRIFLDQLKLKAGLPQGYWSPTIRVSRYATELVE